MKNRFLSLLSILIFVLLSVIGLAACSPAASTGAVPATETLSAPQETPESPIEPSPTPSPELPTVLFMIGTESDPEMAARVEEALRELAAGSQHDLKVLQGLSEDQITPNVSIVVSLGQDLDIGDAAARAPGTNFVVIAQPAAVPGANLSVIGEPAADRERQAFMAGYLAALLSDYYKVAALVPPEGEWRSSLLDSFVVGAEFFCGSCKPLYPPYMDFPQWYDLTEDQAVDGYRPTVDAMAANGVEIVYVPGPLAAPELLTYLGELGIRVIGEKSPDLIRNNWVGTVVADPVPVLRNRWSDWLAGVGGEQLLGIITLIDTDAGLISEGRLRLFDEMNVDLETGLIFPRSVP